MAVLGGMVSGALLMGGLGFIYLKWFNRPLADSVPPPRASRLETGAFTWQAANEEEELTEMQAPEGLREELKAAAPAGNPHNLPAPIPRPENDSPPPAIPDAFQTIASGPAPSSGQSAWLEGIGGMVAGQKITLKREENILGRSRVCDIQFHDPKVSRQHAMIRLYRGHYFIQDMQSSRGTLVNSQPIQTHHLQEGDQIRLGDTVLAFHSPNADKP
jgi:hypothetical protein